MFSKRTNWQREENAYTRTLHRHRASGKAILDLTVSNPTACGFQYDEATILAALSDSAAFRYDPEPKGLPKAREAVIEYYRTKNRHASLNLERLILTTGTSEAYSFLFRLLCEPGDEVVIAQPSYPLFEFLATIHDVKLRPFRLVYDHGWQIDFAALTRAISSLTRAVVVVHPNNPTGHFVSSSEAEQLQKLCLERELALVVDEVFLDYKMPTADTRQKRGSFVFDAQALTFVVSGLSKIAGLPQMKIGWIAAGGPHTPVREAIARLEIVADTYLSLNAPVQHALPTLLAQRGVMQPQIMRRIEENLRALDAELGRQNLVTRLQFEAGWCAVLRVPAVQSDEQLAIRLLEDYSVLVHPGHFYDFPDDGYLVVSLLTLAVEFVEGIRGITKCVTASDRENVGSRETKKSR
jgi:aspartate/methionine/tyrosine aminotransferase